MGKILVFIYDDMADFEITFTTHLLGHELEKEIICVAYDNKVVRSKSGLLFVPTTTIDHVSVDDYEGFILPGGWNPVVKQEMLDIINEFYNKGKLLAAICAAPRYLAKAGILEKVKYTTSIVDWNEARREQFKEDDPFPRQNFINTRVVRDNNVITSKGTSFVDFTIEVADYFGMFRDNEDKKAFHSDIIGI